MDNNKDKAAQEILEILNKYEVSYGDCLNIMQSIEQHALVNCKFKS